MKQITSYLVFILVLLLFAQSCNTKQETVLSVEAALVFKSGDVKPVAITEFFLLHKDFETILQESNFISDIPQKLKETLSTKSPIMAFAVVLKVTKEAERTKYDSPERTAELDAIDFSVVKAITATHPHVAYTTTTDFQGKAQFSDVKPGEYYLFSFTQVGKSVVIWNLKTTVKSGQNSVTLDQKNTSIVY
ncbi:MAG: hypothetical protein M3367_15560 [Acidobacteriota bacterium]|nr:hypothetical protein [Acidobacteriota bacterium]